MSVTIAARGVTNAVLRAPLLRSGFSTTARRCAVGAGPGKTYNSTHRGSSNSNSNSGNHNRRNNSNNYNKTDEVEIPAFNIRHIASSPRARALLVAGFCVIVSVEAYGWYNFGPKILGWEGKGEGETRK